MHHYYHTWPLPLNTWWLAKRVVSPSRFRKPSRESLLTNSYWQRFARDQEMDNISMHRGVDDSMSSREGSKQGSILSRLSAKIKKPQTQDHASLLDDNQGSDAEETEMSIRLWVGKRKHRQWKIFKFSTQDWYSSDTCALFWNFTEVVAVQNYHQRIRNRFLLSSNFCSIIFHCELSDVR